MNREGEDTESFWRRARQRERVRESERERERARERERERDGYARTNILCLRTEGIRKKITKPL